jgi:hypothetical protein
MCSFVNALALEGNMEADLQGYGLKRYKEPAGGPAAVEQAMVKWHKDTTAAMIKMFPTAVGDARSVVFSFRQFQTVRWMFMNKKLASDFTYCISKVMHLHLHLRDLHVCACTCTCTCTPH